MDFSGLLVLVVLWVLFGILGQAKKKPRPEQPEIPRPRDPQRERLPSREASSRSDDTQSEGGKLEQWLRELERTLQEGEGVRSGPMGRRAEVELEAAEEVEERESLEIEPEVVPFPVVVRPERVVVASDDAAEAVALRRVRDAQKRNRALTLADHQAFDRKIRAPVPTVTSFRGLTSDRLKRLREAVVWSEVLGKPKGMD